MFYHIQTLEKAVSNFLPWHERVYKPEEVKFILNKPLSETPLPSNVQERFNTVVIPKTFEEVVDGIRNFKVYEDDTWVICFPRSGSNWTQEAVWQICNGVDTDIKGKEKLKDRFPLLEESCLISTPEELTSLERVEKMERPRFIKSHLPIAFLPYELWKVKPKIVYVARDAKDVAVSWYHLYQDAYLYQGTLDDFLALYLKGEVEYGDNWDHYEQYHLLSKVCSHLKVIKYEEMKKDLKAVLLDLCDFLNKPLSKEKMEQLLHHLSFENMKKNPATNSEEIQKRMRVFYPNHEFRLIRQGKVGSFKEEMSVEMIKKFEKKSEELMKSLK